MEVVLSLGALVITVAIIGEIINLILDHQHENSEDWYFKYLYKKYTGWSYDNDPEEYARFVDYMRGKEDVEK